MRKSILTALAAVAMVCLPVAGATATNAKVTKTAQHANNQMWQPETLSGKITMVDPALKLVVVQDSSGVPFDIKVSSSTRIKSANGMLNLSDLNSDLNRNASINFVPESRGDIAKTINVSQ
jgi:hypothetical protein